MKITYWSDYNCPYCYIADTRMRKALKELGIEKETKITFKAFELYPEAGKVPKRKILDVFIDKYGMSPDQAAAHIARIDGMAHGEGLKFSYGTASTTNTFDALRMTKLAQSKGDEFGERFMDRMFEAFFGENLIMADHDVILRIAIEMGIDEAEAKELLEGDRFAEEVRREEFEARRLGISAVPFYVVNDKYAVPGAVDVSDFKRLFMKAYSEEEAEVKPGMVCGPDGCRPADEE